MEHRISQRQPLACRECTRRKRKCDKKIPCSRCKRLELNCDREIVYLRRHINRHGRGPEIDFLSSVKEELKVATPAEIPRIVQKLTERIESVKSGLPALTNQGETIGRIDETDPGQHCHEPRSSISDFDRQDFSIVTAVEHLAWGRSYGNCYPHRHCACQYHRNWAELSSINSQSFHLAGSEMAAAVSLPSPEDAEKLVSFHIRHITWHHNCVHSPTFWNQCQVFWRTGKCDQPQWIALYCAILSTALFCVQHSARFASNFGFDPAIQTPQALFTTMVNVLYSSHFLNDISLYAIQAIVISTEVAHNLGLSQLNATLFSAAIRIAECLGLHKIENTISTAPAREAWYETIEKEVGKRVWCQMVIQDHFAIPFTDSYGISPAQYSTDLPKNADDNDLVAMPEHVPTISTYTRVLATIARLMPELADGLEPLRDRKPIQEQYKHVLQMDQKMRQVVCAIPSFLLRQDQEREAQIQWLGIARQSLAITAAEKIIMIHRPFIFASFHSDDYALTRRTCVSAALTILREHENIFQSGELSLWTHTAFCITAAVILCFEINIGLSDISEDRFNVYRDAIQAARSRLTERKQDTLAQRGIFLISAIFPEVDGTVPVSKHTLEKYLQKKVDFKEVVTRFSAEWAFLGVEFDADAYSFDNTQIGATVDHGDQIQEYLPDPQVETDFEAWFDDVFATTSTIPL